MAVNPVIGIGLAFVCVVILLCAMMITTLIYYPSASPSPSPSPSPSGGSGTGSKKASQKEVFYIKGSEGSAYTFSKDAAKAACVAAGATLATSAQLTSDHTAGADWCASGWLNDKDPSYPITTSLQPGCSTTAKVVTWKPPGDLAGATCYGVKPTKDANPLVLPFNASKWSRYA